VKLTADIIAGFVGSVLSKRFDNATPIPEFHREIWEMACSEHKNVAIGAPRGHAKSTAGTLSYGLAELLFRSSKFCLIVSDTEAQAAMFLGAMKAEITENEDLIELFGIKKNEKGEVKLVKDTETDMIVEMSDGYMFRVIAKGAEQKLRGLNWNGTRPDLIIVDDLENDELVMNQDRREKLRRWFMGALMPCRSPTGKLRMWGTVLHHDSQLNRLLPRDSDKFIKHSPLKTWIEWPDKRVRGWYSVKYRAHDEEMKHFLWEERFPKEYWIAEKEKYASDGALDLYSQEYLNNPIDESVAYFKRGDLLPMTEEDYKRPVVYYCTVDLAISTETRADWTVFCIAGVDENKILQIRNIIRERMDGREIVDTLLNLHKIYDFAAVGIEEMMISKAIGPFLREEMQRQGIYPPIIQLKHKGKDKVQRARVIQARMRAKTVKFDKKSDWYPLLEEELVIFPRGRHDDQVDALAWLGMLLDYITEAPTQEEIEEEEYNDELQRSGFNLSGRSAITGY
jgi:predicted phage terminase large subunit-like protein